MVPARGHEWPFAQVLAYPSRLPISNNRLPCNFWGLCAPQQHAHASVSMPPSSSSREQTRCPLSTCTVAAGLRWITLDSHSRGGEHAPCDLLQQLGAFVVLQGGRQRGPRRRGCWLGQRPARSPCAPCPTAWPPASRTAAAANPAAAASSPSRAGRTAWPAGSGACSRRAVWSAADGGAASRGQRARAVGELGPSHRPAARVARLERHLSAHAAAVRAAQVGGIQRVQAGGLPLAIHVCQLHHTAAREAGGQGAGGHARWAAGESGRQCSTATCTPRAAAPTACPAACRFEVPRAVRRLGTMRPTQLASLDVL